MSSKITCMRLTSTVLTCIQRDLRCCEEALWQRTRDAADNWGSQWRWDSRELREMNAVRSKDDAETAVWLLRVSQRPASLSEDKTCLWTRTGSGREASGGPRRPNSARGAR